MRETTSLKTLAFKALERLERNKGRNKRETRDSHAVSHPILCETKNNHLTNPFFHPSSLSDGYEERLAIAEYEGHQTPAQAQRIAYVDAFIAVLVTLPFGDSKEDWLEQKIKAAKEWLVSQGMEQPE